MRWPRSLHVGLDEAGNDACRFRETGRGRREDGNHTERHWSRPGDRLINHRTNPEGWKRRAVDWHDRAISRNGRRTDDDEITGSSREVGRINSIEIAGSGGLEDVRRFGCRRLTEGAAGGLREDAERGQPQGNREQ